MIIKGTIELTLIGMPIDYQKTMGIQNTTRGLVYWDHSTNSAKLSKRGLRSLRNGWHNFTVGASTGCATK